MDKKIIVENGEEEELLNYAIKSLKANFVIFNNKQYLVAGGCQYHAFRIRDQAHCVSALSSLKHFDVIQNNLDLYLDNLKKNGLGPVSGATITPDHRFCCSSLRNFFGCVRKRFSISQDDDLIFQYQDDNEGYEFDTNLLILLSIFKIGADDEIILEKMKRIFEFYDKFKIDDIIYQPSYSDWQYSQSRNGPTLTTNILYLEVIKQFSLMGDNNPIASSLPNYDVVAKKIYNLFYQESTGLFKSIAGEEHVSLDGILFILKFDSFNYIKQDNGEICNSKDIYKNLKQNQLWKGSSMSSYLSRIDCLCWCNKLPISKDTHFPGFVTYPNYSPSSVRGEMRLIGLQHYHDSMYWSWLMAFSGEMAYKMNDIIQGDLILKNLLYIIKQEDGNFVHEIYNHNEEFKPFHSLLYSSEKPFSWGAAYIIDMINSRKRSLNPILI